MDGVRIEGIKELRRALNKIDKELTKEFRGELKKIGDDVANDARSSVPSRTGRARGSIRSGMSGNNGYVAGGKKAVPYYGWLDFGSREPRSGNPRSRGPWAKSGEGPKGGRFIYPAINRNRAEIHRRAVRAMEEAKDKSFRGN
jgi:hypothetical protein